MRRIRPEDGFSIIELLVALVILSLGLLSMAATTGYVATQVRIADLRTERAAVLHTAIEGLRATPYDNLTSVTESNATTIGSFRVWWTVTNLGANLKAVTVMTRGPANRAGAQSAAAVDTFVVTIARP